MRYKVLFPGILALTILNIFALNSWANFSMSDSGTTTAQFLKLGVGARAIGMGEAYSAVAADPTAIYWNPAGLAAISEHSLSLMHAVWFESIYYDYFAYAQPIGAYGVIGLGIQYLSAGDIVEMDNDANKIGNFNPTDTAVTISWAEDFQDILIGLSIKYIAVEIKDAASTISSDIGVIYPLFLNKAQVSFSMQNLGGTIKFDTEKEDLPFNARLGLSVNVLESLIVAMDVNTPIDYNPYVCFGGEYCLGKQNDFSLALRAGYNSHTLKSELGGISGFSTGIGFKLWDISTDYAWVPFGDLGTTHRVSLGFKF
ncbi:MAG: PorV/PorQ family protein [bacterium]